jgi:16S rRNA (adenine1518-N6/adenine1519-N6)-dimethyltransferase
MRPKKSLGQNFLISPRISQMIALAGDIEAGETIVEIGPGKGALTKELLATAACVIAIEKDRELIAPLKERFAKEILEKKFEIIEGDVLEKDVTFSGKYKLIANIPYYITGAIIEKFCSSKNPPTLMVIMVQREVAERILARDGKESILSISVKVFGTPSIVMKVARGNFFPIPNVDSAVLKISDIKNPFASKKEEETFFEFLKKGFAHKRKKLTSNLDLSVQEIETLQIPKNARAEDMPLEFWKNLTEKL